MISLLLFQLASHGTAGSRIRLPSTVIGFSRDMMLAGMRRG